MKTVDFRLQKEVENINEHSQDWFKKHVKEVLESNKPYHVKADYIGLSMQELDNKISYLAYDIKEMQTLKKNLTNAKTIALEAIASVLVEYGIDRLDGTAISSITITPERTKMKETLSILDPEALIKLGYFKAVVDVEAVKEAMCTLESMDEIDRYTQVEVEKEITPARIKVNAKRNSQNNQASELLKLVDSQEAS